MWIEAQINPLGKLVGDCVIRAIAIATGMTWDETYIVLSDYGMMLKNLPNANEVWGAYLKDRGFTRHVIPNTCPDCYTIRDFCKDHPHGTYVVCTGSHTVACINGNAYDAWNSLDEVPCFYWEKKS